MIDPSSEIRCSSPTPLPKEKRCLSTVLVYWRRFRHQTPEVIIGKTWQSVRWCWWFKACMTCDDASATFHLIPMKRSLRRVMGSHQSRLPICRKLPVSIEIIPVKTVNGSCWCNDWSSEQSSLNILRLLVLCCTVGCALLTVRQF